MGDVIEKFFISIGVDAKDLKRDIENAVKSAADAMKKKLSSVFNADAAMAAKSIALIAVALGGFVRSTYEEIINLNKLAESLGTTTERLQMWQGAAEDAGVATKEVGDVWQRMNTMIAEASTNGKGTLANFVNSGILPSLTTVDGKIKDTESYMLELADAFANMDKQTATLVGGKLGIKGDFLDFLSQGSGSINQQLGHIKQLGVYTKEDVKIAKEFEKSLKDLRKAFNDIVRSLKTALMPVFRTIVPLLTQVARGVEYLTKHMRIFIPAALAVAGVIAKSLIPGFLKLGGTALEWLKSPAFLKLALIVGVLVAIGLAIEDIMVWMEGGESVIGDYLGSWEEFGPKVQKGVQDALQWIADFVTAIQDFIQPIFDFFNDFIAQIEAVGNAFMELGDIASTAAENAKNGIYDNFISPVIEWFDDLMNKIRNFFSFLGTIGSTIAGIGSSVGGLLVRGNAGNIDNSNRNTSVVQNNTFNGVTGATDAANRLMGNNPVPAANTAY